MTHPIYTQHALEGLPTVQLKAIAHSIGAIPDGDKRSKQTWIDAIISHQTAFSPVKCAAMEAHIETVTNRMESIPSDADETHTDDEAFAAAMGLSYEDVFGNPLGDSEWEEIALETYAQSLKPNPQVSAPTAPTREASIVALVVVLAFGLAFLIIKLGFASIAWIIAALLPLALGLWGYLFPATKQASIDYFPQV